MIFYKHPKTKIHPFDDYKFSNPNQTTIAPMNLTLIGTITTQVGNPALRHNWKLLLEL